MVLVAACVLLCLFLLCHPGSVSAQGDKQPLAGLNHNGCVGGGSVSEGSNGQNTSDVAIVVGGT
eukprot:6147555-Lingulodinium_polyedra.AAC.1